MRCYHPIKAFRTPHGVVFRERHGEDIIESVELPCGMCIGCRMRRASDWTVRCMHEAQFHECSCFVTLTYGRDALPPNGSLDHRDFQLFFKRLRKFIAPGKVRYFMCGEYGPETGRPHYHANLFGVDFRSDRVACGKSASGQVLYSSPTLAKLWSFGHCTVQDLTRESAGYTARYIMKKQLGRSARFAYDVIDADGVVAARRAEYAAMSLKPGIGSQWFEKYGRDVFPRDYVVVDGAKSPVPIAYSRKFKKRADLEVDAVEYARHLRALDSRADSTDERLKVREAVHLAKVRNLTRGL